MHYKEVEKKLQGRWKLLAECGGGAVSYKDGYRLRHSGRAVLVASVALEMILMLKAASALLQRSGHSLEGCPRN